MSLSATRSRRSNAGNRWAEALAAALVENGDKPDPDAEMSGDEFVGKEEEDVFESDFESTDEEEYAKEGAQDEEKQVMAEERAERRAARAKASKSAAAPAQRILERAMRGEPMKKKPKATVKAGSDRAGRKSAGDNVVWDSTRQSRRTSTVKHKALVRERLKDAEQRKAHAVKRPRKATVTKTQDELIAEALELEEKNTKSLQEFLVKEEEKRAAARRVVRMRIEGPKLRWISRAEDVRVRIEEVTPTSTAAYDTPLGTGAPLANATTLPNKHGTLHQPARSPLSQSVILPQADNIPASAPEPASQSTSALALTTPQTTAQSSPTTTQALQNERASATPAPSNSGRRMQMYVELPRRSVSGSQRAPNSTSSQPLPSISISEPSSQSVSKGPASSSQPLPATQPLIRAPSLARSLSGRSVKSASPVDILAPIRPNSVRQASVSSTGSNRSRMMMYVELPAPKYERGSTPAPSTPAPPAVPTVEGKGKEQEATPKPSARSIDHSLFPPGGPNFAIVLPQRKHNPTTHKKERQMKNYIVVELSGKERASFGARMRAIFGDHANWSEVLLKGAKPSGSRAKPVCAITGLDAPYRDPRTGIPYANAYAYKNLTRLLKHEFVWSQEKGCYVGDEGKNAARGVPRNWSVAATGRT